MSETMLEAMRKPHTIYQLLKCETKRMDKRNESSSHSMGSVTVRWAQRGASAMKEKGIHNPRGKDRSGRADGNKHSGFWGADHSLSIPGVEFTGIGLGIIS